MVTDHDLPVNGTLIWYYTVCHRQVWLMARHLTPDEQDDNVVLGKAELARVINGDEDSIIFYTFRSTSTLSGSPWGSSKVGKKKSTEERCLCGSK